MTARKIEWKRESHTLGEAEIKVYEFLESMQMEFIAYHHEAAPTVEHVSGLESLIIGRHCKNLFLKNSKGDQLFLLIAPYDKKVHLPQIAKSIGSTRLSFASPALMQQYLGLDPGSVSPFGLLNDDSGSVQVLLDESLSQYDWISFHPNVNTATLSIKYIDLERFLDRQKNVWRRLAVTDGQENR